MTEKKTSIRKIVYLKQKNQYDGPLLKKKGYADMYSASRVVNWDFPTFLGAPGGLFLVSYFLHQYHKRKHNALK